MFKVTCSIKALLLGELPSEMTGIAGVSVSSEAVAGTLKASTEVCGIPGLLNESARKKWCCPSDTS